MTLSNGARVLVIVPAYNEETNICAVIDQLAEYPQYDVLVVNDASTDRTPLLLSQKEVRHVDLVANLGIGGGVQTGYIYADRNGYDIAVQFDGDGQHDAAYIEKIIEPIIAGRADYVVGSRFVGHESDFKSSFARRCGIHVLSFAVKVRTGVRVYDVTSGFRAVNRDVIKRLAACYPVDYPEPESLAMVLRSGLSVEEVGVAMHERSGGESSISGFSSILYMAKVGLAILLAEEMG